MNWEEFEALCSTKMERYYDLIIQSYATAFRADIALVVNGRIVKVEPSDYYRTREEALTHGMNVIRTALKLREQR